MSVWPSLAPNLYKSRSGSSTRLSSTSLGVCFIKGLTFFVKLTSDFTLNFSLDIGRHECSLGWSENLSKLGKFKRSDQANCGFSIRTWKSFSTPEISKIYFLSQIGRTALTDTLSYAYTRSLNIFSNLDVWLKGFKDVNVLYIQVLLTATSLQVIIYTDLLNVVDSSEIGTL